MVIEEVYNKIKSYILATCKFISLSFSMASFYLFIFTPSLITYLYISISLKYSFYRLIHKASNRNLSLIISSVFYAVRSMEPRDVLSKIILVSSLIMLVQSDNVSLAPIFQSMLAAVVFDFIVIRLPNEYNKQMKFIEIRPDINKILNALMAIRALTIESVIGKNGISKENIDTCIDSIKGKRFNSEVRETQRVSNSPSYVRLRLRTKEKKGIVSINDEIFILLLEASESFHSLSLKIDTPEFGMLSKYIFSFGAGSGFFSESIYEDINNFNSNESLPCNLNLSNHDYCTSLIDGFLIPMEGVCYWYKRKMLRYMHSEYRGLLTFNFRSIALHAEYDVSKCYASSFLNPTTKVERV